MKDILNKLFASLFADYKPEDLLKYLYIGNLGLLTFIFIIMGMQYDLLGFNGASGD
jgi:hypothetical protein